MSQKISQKIEEWKRYGQVIVYRDTKGRFLSWEKMQTNPFSHKYGGKRVAVYGFCSNDKGKRSRRYEFIGSGSEISRAIAKSCYVVPRRRFVIVRASEFLRNPYRYGVMGYWLDRPEINS